MLNDFSWSIFQLEPEPPVVGNLNDYNLSAL